jgi:undecaprenyl-diphosphatase
VRTWGGLLRQAQASLFLTLLFLGFLALSLVVHTPELLRYDLYVTSWLQGLRSPALDGFARAITFLGNSPPLIALGLAFALMFLRAGYKAAAWLSAAIPPFGLILNVLIKELIGRPRPDDGLVYVLLTPIGLSFPSGHAMVPAMFFGFLALMSWIHLRPSAWRLASTMLLVLLIVLIGLSRVYLGVHWLSDVIGGWTGGLLLLLVLARVYGKVEKPSSRG